MFKILLSGLSLASIASAQRFGSWGQGNPGQHGPGSSSHGGAPHYGGPPMPCNTQNIPSSQPPAGSWLGWGADVYNNRRAAVDAKLSKSNLGSLHQKCSYPAAGQSAPPLVINNVAYFTTWSGLLVAYEYAACRTVWELNVTQIIANFAPIDPLYAAAARPFSRSTPQVDGNTLFIGTLLHSLLVAVDKIHGTVIDVTQVDDHPLGVLTQSPTIWKSKLYIGTSSQEELGADIIPGYQCCSFMGSMNAYELVNGRFQRIWQQYMLPVDSGFSGNAVWGSAPAIDPIRSQVFIATGNVYTVPKAYEACQNETANIEVYKNGNVTDPCVPDSVYQEAVIALDLDTGLINWVRSIGPLDAWNVACIAGTLGLPITPGVCPPNAGPDADFGMAPTYVPASSNTPYGRDVVVVGQKSGVLYAMSAQAGALYWATQAVPGGSSGGLSWGVAVDDENVYWTGINWDRKAWDLSTKGGIALSNSAWGASSLKDGRIVWQTQVPRNSTSTVAPTVVNDVILTGVTGSYDSSTTVPFGDGTFVVLDKATGEILHEFDENSAMWPGIAAVQQYVMFGSGYSGSSNGTFQVWSI